MRSLREATVFSCVKLIVVRDGSAILSGEFGQRPANIGDVLLIGANVPCGAEPEGQVTVTTVYLDPDYAVEMFYWQHAGLLLDRLEAHDIAALVFAEPVQVLRLGKQRLGKLAPWLDELVELSNVRSPAESFARIQTLWFSVAEVLRPHIKTMPVTEVLAQSAKARPRSLRHRRLAVRVRVEALTVRDALHSNIARRWPLRDLAEMVQSCEATRPRVQHRLWQDAPRLSREPAGRGDGATAARGESDRGCRRASGGLVAHPRPRRCSSGTSVSHRAGTASTGSRAPLWEAVRTYLVRPARHDPRTGSDHEHAKRTTADRTRPLPYSARSR